MYNATGYPGSLYKIKRFVSDTNHFEFIQQLLTFNNIKGFSRSKNMAITLVRLSFLYRYTPWCSLSLENISLFINSTNIGANICSRFSIRRGLICSYYFCNCLCKYWYHINRCFCRVIYCIGYLWYRFGWVNI